MKKVILLFVLLFSLSFIFAESGWGDTNVGNDSTTTTVSSDNASDSSGSDVTPVTYESTGTSGGGSEYTENYYIAIGVGLGGLLLLILFAYLFLHRPKNRWRKKEVSNVKLVKSEKQ